MIVVLAVRLRLTVATAPGTLTLILTLVPTRGRGWLVAVFREVYTVGLCA